VLHEMVGSPTLLPKFFFPLEKNPLNALGLFYVELARRRLTLFRS
jgi:hypothetical protein